MKHLGSQRLETERLILRQFELNDAEMMYTNWANDPQVTEYLTWIEHQSVNETEELIKGWVKGYCHLARYHWAVVVKDDYQVIGSIGAVTVLERDCKAVLGYCLARPYWNKGYATEALQAVVDYFFGRVGFNRLEALHVKDNEASGRVMAKVGMKKEGEMPQYIIVKGHKRDMVLYGLLFEKWQRKK